MRFIRQHQSLLLLFSLFLLFRLPNLTLLPIWNDEAIYLDWAWRETNTTGNLYYSLYDAKQPLLLWIFGISEHLFADQLFAGRVISVLFGLFTMLGVYKLGKMVFSQRVAVLASILLIILPIGVFYDRLALMETSVAAIGVWSCYFLLRTCREQTLQPAILLGLVLGLGFFIKSSTLLFLIISLGFFIKLLFTQKDKRQLATLIGSMLLTFFCTILLLLINPQFWATLSKNNQYAMTIHELLHFPLGSWLQNLRGNMEILWFFTTPFVFLVGIFGIFRIYQTPQQQPRLLVTFLLVGFFLETLSTKFVDTRYLYPFLPLFTLPVAFALQNFFMSRKLSKGLQFFCVFAVFLAPLCLSLFYIGDPYGALKGMAKLTKYSDTSFIMGQTAGYGTKETISYLTKRIRDPLHTTIGYAQNTGNPESALIVAFQKQSVIKTAYLDSGLIGGSLNRYDCLSIDRHVYFVSRDEQQAGLNNFLEKVETIQKPDGVSTIGIYKMKENCTGKTLKLKVVIR